MSDYRLKIKIGEHEFEAEGPTEVVQAQFAMFKELLANAPASQKKQAPVEPEPQSDKHAAINGHAGQPMAFDKIMLNEGRIVSLTVHPDSVDDAILAILLGQRHFRFATSVEQHRELLACGLLAIVAEESHEQLEPLDGAE